jgi:preprotein translocase subunit SecA
MCRAAMNATLFLLATTSVVRGYVAVHTIGRTSSTTTNRRVGPFLLGDRARGPTFPAIVIPRHSSTTPSLNMGVVEEFVAGRDAETRRASNDAYLAKLRVRVDNINRLESTIEELDDMSILAKTNEFRKRINEDGESIDVNDVTSTLIDEAFAVVREAAWRVLEQRHYDVQLLGGLVLHDGRLAEMATGEGKTLVSTLPCYLNALVNGRTSFVITVNDYLARRDMEKMGQVHRYLGLSVGLVQAGMTEDERRVAYSRNVVYVTNSELGFDYLRDHLALSPAQTVLPESAFGNGYCVVDEADSVLIDEARTPLIISKQVPAPSGKYRIANTLADNLRPGVHYDVDVKNKNVILNERGYKDCERALGVTSLFEEPSDATGAWAPFVLNAIKARELFAKDVDYTVLPDGRGVGIIDSFTGRVLDGRRWSDGLHQSIEAKEGIEVSEMSKVIAKVTYQVRSGKKRLLPSSLFYCLVFPRGNRPSHAAPQKITQSLFRQFTRLSGMTGTALTDAAELEFTYGLLVTPIPTALPIARRDYPDVAFRTRAAANKALVREVLNVGGGTKDGRPCLIGTTSVVQSAAIVKALADAGVNAELLNALPENAARESEIVAQAGRPGVVTVATNMAGRGTDIILGGCPGTMARLRTRSFLLDQGVLGVEERKFYPRPPDDGYYPCDIDDDIAFMLKDAASSLRKEFGDGLTAIKFDEILTVATDTTEGDDDPAYIVKLRDAAQAVKVTFQEKLAPEKEIVRSRGGLYVMGTNRHESSRIDGQLRGRAGRQGDPGTSRFFLSFEDDMFVIFGGDGLQNVLRTFRVSEDMPIEAPQVTDALNKVQLAVEEKYRDIRGQILDFDDVLDGQRRVFYRRRQQVLFSNPETTLRTMDEYHRETVSDIVKAQTNEDGTVKVGKVLEKMGQFFPSVLPVVTVDDIADKEQDQVISFLVVAVEEIFKAKVDELEKKAKVRRR